MATETVQRKKFHFLQNIYCNRGKDLLYYIGCPWIRTSAFFDEEVLSMAKCEFCDKGVTFGITVSHSHRRANRMWKPNVKRVKAIVDGTPKHVYVCTRCLRSGKVTRAV